MTPTPADEPDTAPETLPDVQSDPAEDDGTSTDWSSEGGAADEGPATAVDDDDA